MNKALALFLFVAGLVAFAQAADIAVNVGNAKGENVFEPNMVMAAPGDNIVFTWVSGKHSILQEAKAKDCVKTADAAATFIDSGGAFPAPKTWTLVAPKVAGKTWFFCGVQGHCNPGQGGMEALLIVGDGGAPAAGGAAPKDGAPAAGGAGANSTTPAAPGGSPAPNAASRNYNTFVSAGVVFSSMCMAAAYML